MPEKESHRVETLSEFIEWAAQFNDEKYLFRGVPNDCYKIEASAYAAACQKWKERIRIGYLESISG